MFEHIPIFCATDENYAPFTSIMMISVLLHTDSFIDFYIMDGGIKAETKKLIAKDLKKYSNKTITFIDMSRYNFDRFPNLAYYSLNTFSRYFIPQIAPNLSKIIYLDVDVIVKKDIKTFFELDLENHPIAAMPESDYFSRYSFNKLRKQVMPHYKKTSAYFNAGILLLDIPKLIAMDFTSRAIALTSRLRHRLTFPDQEVLNILFEDNYKKFDYRFNFLVCSENKFKTKCPDVALDDLAIIHYAGSKPWKDHTSFQQDFDDVLKTSIFYKNIVQKWRSNKVKKTQLLNLLPFLQALYIEQDHHVL